MKVPKIWVVMALMLAMGQAQVSSRESDRARVLSLENAWNEAEKNKDTKAIDGLLAASFTYTDSDGTLMNKQQFLESIGAPSYHPEQIVNDSMNAQAYEHSVVVVGTYREKGVEKGKAYVRRGRFTDVWVQEKSGWLCAASHETLISH
jgi:hypothetical protein